MLIAHGTRRGETLGIKYAELLENDGNGAFIEVSHSSGLLNSMGRGRTSSWVDFNSDGFLDVYMANYLSRNVLYRNNGDGTFSDVSAPMALDGSGSRAAWSDLNFDGRPDLLVSWPLGISQNNGGTVFSSITDATMVYNDLLRDPPYSLALGDLDGDGDNDLVQGGFLTAARVFWKENSQFMAAENTLYSAESSQRGATVKIVDIDNDSDLDILTTASGKLYLHRNLSARKFRLERIILMDNDEEVIAGESVAVGDLNSDGYPDLALQTKTQNVIALNQNTGNRWLKLNLHGTKSNRQGIGSKIWIELDNGKTIYREHWGHHGVYRSLSCTAPLFGVAKSKQVNLKVVWPSGTSKHYLNVPTNRTLVLHETPVASGITNLFLLDD